MRRGKRPHGTDHPIHTLSFISVSAADGVQKDSSSGTISLNCICTETEGAAEITRGREYTSAKANLAVLAPAVKGCRNVVLAGVEKVGLLLDRDLERREAFRGGWWWEGGKEVGWWEGCRVVPPAPTSSSLWSRMRAGSRPLMAKPMPCVPICVDSGTGSEIPVPVLPRPCPCDQPIFSICRSANVSGRLSSLRDEGERKGTVRRMGRPWSETLVHGCQDKPAIRCSRCSRCRGRRRGFSGACGHWVRVQTQPLWRLPVVAHGASDTGTGLRSSICQVVRWLEDAWWAI